MKLKIESFSKKDNTAVNVGSVSREWIKVYEPEYTKAMESYENADGDFVAMVLRDVKDGKGEYTEYLVGTKVNGRIKEKPFKDRAKALDYFKSTRASLEKV